MLPLSAQGQPTVATRVHRHLLVHTFFCTAADRPAAVRLLAVAAAGRSAACYTTTRDTT